MVVVSVSIHDLSKNDVVVDINKGIALRKIGLYSANTVEEVAHSFIPFSNFCATSPDTEVCLYASLPIKTNVVKLATILSPNYKVRGLSGYTKDEVSKLIGKNLVRILSLHRPNEFVQNAKSSIHFVNDRLHYDKNSEQTAISTTSTDAVDNYSNISVFSPTSIEIILKQISGNKISFEYLSQHDLKQFLVSIFAKIDTSYTISNVEETLESFSQLIVGQSIYALRYCSLGQESAALSQPCLVVSTLYLRLPMDGTPIFTIYRLIPLPVLYDNDVYIYSSLPRIIGINSIDQRILVWKEDNDANDCILSSLVQCATMPASAALSKSKCLSQLLDDTYSNTNSCQVRKSSNIEQGIVNIADGVWQVYDVHNVQYCQLHSKSGEQVESFSFNEASIINLPCNKTITCADYQLPASVCTKRQVFVTPRSPSYLRSHARFVISIQNMSRTIISSYNSQVEWMIDGVTKGLQSKKAVFKRIFEEILIYCFLAISLLAYIIYLYLIRFMNQKLNKKINNFSSILEETMTA